MSLCKNVLKKGRLIEPVLQGGISGAFMMLKQGIKYFFAVINYFFTLFCAGILLGLIISFFVSPPPERLDGKFCLTMLTEQICITHKRIF